MIKNIIKGNGVFFVLGIIVFVALLLKFFYNPQIDLENNDRDIKNLQKFILEGDNQIASSTSVSKERPLIKVIRPIIEAPQSGTLVSSPLVVKGQAPDNWFFEASLPIRLLDNEGRVIAQAEGLAKGDSLTENLIPFSALLEFNTTATSGQLLINNDNPSGLPEYSRSIGLPVLFLNE